MVPPALMPIFPIQDHPDQEDEQLGERPDAFEREVQSRPENAGDQRLEMRQHGYEVKAGEPDRPISVAVDRDRKSVLKGKNVSVRVDTGVRRHHKNKKTN